MARFKRILSPIVLLILTAYATWKGMQTLAIVAILLFLASLYPVQVKRLMEIIFVLFRQTRQAKFGDFEVNIKDDPLKQAIFENLVIEKEWMKAIIGELTPAHISLILAIHKAGEFKFKSQVRHFLRNLRDLQLLDHNKDTLAESDTVYLTDLGNEIAGVFVNAAELSK